MRRIQHPYVYLDGIVLKRSWAGEVRNVSLLVATAVNDAGYREILGICEGAKEDKAGWSGFLKHLKERGLTGVRLIISDACLGLAESAAEFFPEAGRQISLDFHVGEAAPDGARKSVPCLGLAVEALRAPAMPSIEALIFYRPALTPAARAARRDNDHRQQRPY